LPEQIDCLVCSKYYEDGLHQEPKPGKFRLVEVAGPRRRGKMLLLTQYKLGLADYSCPNCHHYLRVGIYGGDRPFHFLLYDVEGDQVWSGWAEDWYDWAISWPFWKEQLRDYGLRVFRDDRLFHGRHSLRREREISHLREMYAKLAKAQDTDRLVPSFKIRHFRSPVRQRPYFLIENPNIFLIGRIRDSAKSLYSYIISRRDWDRLLPYLGPRKEISIATIKNLLSLADSQADRFYAHGIILLVWATQNCSVLQTRPLKLEIN